jgi:hypothetical protein
MNKAIVTLAIGNRYADLWKIFCKDNWNRYATRRGYEIICIDTPLDSSTRAKSRSPAWQKCLVLSQPWSDKYERIVWVDSDILMNSYAPDVSEGVPLDKVGAADEYSYPTAELYQVFLDRVSRYLPATGTGFIEEHTAQQYHANFGLPSKFNKVVQTGVLVLNSKYHRELLEHVYYTYEDKPGLNYEMRPLSYELQNEDMVQWIDSRFNALWGIYNTLYRPYSTTRALNESKFGRPIRRIYYSRLGTLLSRFYSRFQILFIPAIDTEAWRLKSAYLHNYFLHFAACPQYLPRLNWKDIDLSS